MIPISVIKKKNDDAIEFNNNTHCYAFNPINGHFIMGFVPLNDYRGLKLLDLVSENKKIFITGGVGPFHIIIETIFTIMDISKKYPDIEFIIDTYEIDSKANHGFIDLMKDHLSEHINMRFLNTSGFEGILINNYAVVNGGGRQGHFDKSSILNNVKHFSMDSGPADKKVYISRKEYPYNSHTRVSDEAELEDFFIRNNFQIVHPERFGSIREQIDFFSTVKTVASLSSSGLSWLLFMKPGGNVLELQTSFPDYLTETLHHQYQAMSYVMDLNYHSIPNYDKDSKGLIKLIEDSKILSII